MFEHLTPKAKGAAEWLADYLEAAYLDGFTVDTLLEYIEPLLSALGETPWRPIDEAPKDGTWLILGWGNRVAMGFWGRKFSRHGVNYGDAWGDGYSWCDQFGEGPTHWMPLPAPPTEAQP